MEKIDHGSFLCFRFAVRTLYCHGNAVADQEILFFVDLKERGCGQAFFECDLRFKYLCLGDPRI